MTEAEFRSDLLAAAASRAEAHCTGMREAFVDEVTERLREADEMPGVEACAEALVGHRGRRLELDAYAFDEADLSLHLFIAIRDGGAEMPPPIGLAQARELGFNRLLGFYEQARDGWLTKNTEESRPLWALARRIETAAPPAALRLSVLTDRAVSERLRAIPEERTKEGVPVTFQVWDVTRLKRVHEALNVRDDLHVDFSSLSGGGLTALPAAAGFEDYDAYLTVIPGELLADIYILHGSRLLEGNVRTFLGRRGSINKGIASTLAKEPSRFFAYNNGIAATASAITTVPSTGRTRVLTGATDLQIVNGAQTTASLAALRREGKLPESSVFVPMKLSVVAPAVAAELIPRISRFANSQNSVRASDFFANHEFHRKLEEMSRRVLAPAIGGSQVQTHWFYERARGAHLNEQADLTEAKKAQFLRMNPRAQVITKTDLAKVENCFDMLPDVTSKGAEKSFVQFAERVTEDWKEERKRALYGDDWFRAAVARVIMFRAIEGLVSNAPWYEGGYRAQIVAYTLAKLAALVQHEAPGGRFDFQRVWTIQRADDVVGRQILLIAKEMAAVLLSPPQSGQNVSEWAKQQACRKIALERDVGVDPDFGQYILAKAEARAANREQRSSQRVTEGLAVVTEVLGIGAAGCRAIQAFARDHRLLLPEDERALEIACAMPRYVPTDKQAERILAVLDRCREAGFERLVTVVGTR